MKKYFPLILMIAVPVLFALIGEAQYSSVYKASSTVYQQQAGLLMWIAVGIQGLLVSIPLAAIYLKRSMDSKLDAILGKSTTTEMDDAVDS